MDNTYSSKYSGEQVDAAVEYFLNHSQTEESNSYEYTNTIFCRSDGFPASPFNESSLPTLMPLEFPFAELMVNYGMMFLIHLLKIGISVY